MDRGDFLMARSKIIKDLANGTVDTLTALKRAKVLFASLDNEELLQWISYEIIGYPDEKALPDYRIAEGNLTGSYFKGSMMSHMKYNNVSLPLGKMPEETKRELLSIKFYEGVGALKQLAENSEKKNEFYVGKQLSADFFPYIAHFNNDPYMNIISASVKISSQSILNILSAVENKLLDSLLLLEREFGILDELDLDTASKSAEELQEIADQLTIIIFNDQSIHIGDNNKIKGSSIGSNT